MQRLFDDDDCYWTRISCADERAFEIFKRHYTFRAWRQRNKKNGKRFVGPGEEITLISKCGKALFVWRKEKFRMDEQTGVNCAVFRNEGNILSSVLIQQAEIIAWNKWPAERLYTFVNAKKIKSVNPGFCFKKAGWKSCGLTKAKKLIILEKIMFTDFNSGTRANPKMDLTEEQRNFLLENHKRMTNKMLAEAMHVSTTKVWTWLTEMGIKKNKGRRLENNLHFENSGLFIHDKNLATI